MKRFVAALAAALLTGAGARAQSVTLPPEVRGEPGAWVVVVPAAKDGGDVKWKVGPGLTVVPVDRLFPGQKPAGVVVQGPKGRYEVWAWCAKGDVASDLAVCAVVIGDAPPGPKPPGPGPKPDPTPPAPVTGLRVLVVEETAERTKLPAAQLQILFSKQVRDWLDARCMTDPSRPDWKAWRVWDKDTDAAAAHKFWQDALRLPRKATPWVHVFDGDREVHSGPLPADVPAMLALLNQFAPAKGGR